MVFCEPYIFFVWQTKCFFSLNSECFELIDGGQTYWNLEIYTLKVLISTWKQFNIQNVANLLLDHNFCTEEQKKPRSDLRVSITAARNTDYVLTWISEAAFVDTKYTTMSAVLVVFCLLDVKFIFTSVHQVGQRAFSNLKQDKTSSTRSHDSKICVRSLCKLTTL